MKKLSKFLLIILIISALVGCSNSTGGKNNKIKIGVSPRPHGDIVKFIKEDLEKEGVELEILEFTDYVTPNIALDDGDLDANFFQHLPYLEEFNEDRDLNLISLGTIHLEPMGLYSTRLASIDELSSGNTIAIPNDVTNAGRALLLLEKEGIIKLDESKGILATENDILDNPLNLEFKPLEAATLPQVLADVDAAIINGNYALEADLTLDKALILEDKDSPYANIIAVKEENKDKENIQKLMKVLQSDKTRDYIENGFENSIVPAF